MEAEDNSDGERQETRESGSGGSSEETDEEEQFDISLAATHSYMGGGLVAVRGRSVLEAGWRGSLPLRAHHGAVFPGETVPMLLPDAHDAALLARAVHADKLFGLLCPDESGTLLSGYGVVCEVFEAAVEGEEGGEGGAPAQRPYSVTFKARATHRFRFLDMSKHAIVPLLAYARVRVGRVCVLGEDSGRRGPAAARLASLDPLRRAHPALDRQLRAMDAAVTPWPPFLYDIFDYERMRRAIVDYFKTLMFDKLPEEPVSLSFWVASNLALRPRDRLALFLAHSALQRLHMELRLIARKSVLCCSSCLGEIARHEHMLAMSSAGVTSNYTNLGGYMHDVLTVSRAANTALSGAPETEYSWFPGYAWTIALCRGCMAHVGWRFDAQKRSLRPQQFYGLCRNYVQPRFEDDNEETT